MLVYIFHTHETSLLLLGFLDFKSFTNCGLKKSYARLFKMGRRRHSGKDAVDKTENLLQKDVSINYVVNLRKLLFQNFVSSILC